MRTIYLVHTRWSAPEIRAFSQERSARRFIERRYRRMWQDATDFEKVAEPYLAEIARVRRYGEEHVRRAQENMQEEMARVRALVDRGYADFRRRHQQEGHAPYMTQVTLYRTLAEYDAATA